MPPARANTSKKLVVSTPQARKRKDHLKSLALNKQNEARGARLQAQLDSWFEEFDTDGDQQFNREELAKLLAHLNPGAPPTDEQIDRVMLDATAVWSNAPATRPSKGIYDSGGRRTIMAGDVEGTIHRDKLSAVVKKYSAFVKEQARIDAIFDKFDEDNSGSLVSLSPAVPAIARPGARVAHPPEPVRVRVGGRTGRSCCR